MKKIFKEIIIAIVVTTIPELIRAIFGTDKKKKKR